MRTSSSQQLEINFSSDVRSTEISAPNWNKHWSQKLDSPIGGSVLADTSRIAGLINAAAVTVSEFNDWVRERQELLDKMEAGTITKAGLNRLDYVRWNLDRIEAAKNGQLLDTLERMTSEYEELVPEIRSFISELSRNAARR